MSATVTQLRPQTVTTPKPKPRSSTNYGGLLLRGGIWHIRKVIKGITIAESTKTGNRRLAEQIMAKRVNELTTEVVLAGKKPIKLHAGIDAFLASRSHLPSHQTCCIHLGYFKEVPDNYLDKISDVDLQAMIQGKRNDGYAESTLKVSVSYFNATIKFLDEQGYTVRKKLKPIKHDSGKIVWLTKPQLALLYAELDPAKGVDDVMQAQKQANFDLVRLLYETGGRLTEVLHMTWDQVDLVKGTVYMRRLKGSVSNTILMTRTMKEIFTRLAAGNAAPKGYVLADKHAQDDWRASGKKRANASNVWFNKAVIRADLDQSRGSITPHTLRHTRAVHLLQGGLELLELKTYLGHKAIQSTMVYAHVAEGDVMRKAVAVTDA